MIRISFIIPCYNIEDYIEECVLSLIKLHLPNDEYEILIINDGSVDNSLLECQKLENKHKNIKVFNQNNQGVSFCRNVGTKYAQGYYVCFVDGDDFHISDGIVNILEIAEKNCADIVRGKYLIYKDNNYYKNNNNNCSFYNKLLSGEEFLINTIKNKENEVVPWLGVFKREFLINNSLFFDPSISYEEDQIYFLKCLLTNKVKIIQTNDYFYAYRYRMDSTTKKPSMNQIENVIKVVKLEEMLTKNKNQKIKRYIRRYECSSFFQLTSIYGRIDKSLRKEANNKIDFNMKIRCLLNPYDFHQFVKVFLFTFFRWFVDLIYDLRKD